MVSKEFHPDKWLNLVKRVEKLESTGEGEPAKRGRSPRGYDKRRQLKHKFGVSLQWYDEQVLIQGGVCYVCKRPPASNKSLCVDHNHSTGEIRKLLCHNCNVSLGMLKEDVDIMKSMIEYVVEHSK